MPGGRYCGSEAVKWQDAEPSATRQPLDLDLCFKSLPQEIIDYTIRLVLTRITIKEEIALARRGGRSPGEPHPHVRVPAPLKGQRHHCGELHGRPAARGRFAAKGPGARRVQEL